MDPVFPETKPVTQDDVVAAVVQFLAYQPGWQLGRTVQDQIGINRRAVDQIVVKMGNQFVHWPGRGYKLVRNMPQAERDAYMLFLRQQIETINAQILAVAAVFEAIPQTGPAPLPGNQSSAGAPSDQPGVAPGA